MTERIVDRAALPSTSPRAPLTKGEHGVLAKGRLPADSLLSFRPKHSFLLSARAKPWLLRERGAATKRSCKARLRGLLRAQFAATSAWRNPCTQCRTKGSVPLHHAPRTCNIVFTMSVHNSSLPTLGAVYVRFILRLFLIYPAGVSSLQQNAIIPVRRMTNEYKTQKISNCRGACCGNFADGAFGMRGRHSGR